MAKRSREQQLDRYLAVVEVTTTGLELPPSDPTDTTTGLARAVFLVDSSGVPVTNPNQIEGMVADGGSATGVNPVLVSGVDGSGNEQSLSTDTSGRLVPQPQGYGAATTKTRSNNTTPYDAGDVIGSDTSTSGAFQFSTLAGAAGGDVIITSASLEIDITAIPSGMTNFNLALYNVTPPSALADGATWDLPSGDRASFLGIFSLGAPVDLGSTLYVEVNQVNKQITMASANLFGYLITVGAYTPAASSVFKVTLHTVAT